MHSSSFSKNFFLALFVLTFFCAFSAQAEDEGVKITRPMTAIDPVTLQSDDGRYTLWGIQPPPEAQTGLQALEMMDNLIGHEPVTCKVLGSSPRLARCTVHTGEDLGIELLNHGYAVVDRRQTLNSVYASAYAGAQETARRNGSGIWRKAGFDDGAGAMPASKEMLQIWGPLAGIFLLALMIHFRLRRMESLQQEELERTHRKESTLMTRERQVLLSTLEGEMEENKNRIEAFLTIYGDMLRDLKLAGTEVPKYQQTGEIIQKRPSLSKAIFENSMGKLSLLDMKLAGQLSKIYTSLPKEQEYITIEPHVPLASAIALLEKVLKEAEDMLPPVNQVLSALEEAARKSPAA